MSTNETLVFNTGLWHKTLSVIAMPAPRGRMMCGEFPVTCILTDLKGHISYQFISSSVKKEKWAVCYSDLKLMGRSWSLWTMLLLQGILQGQGWQTEGKRLGTHKKKVNYSKRSYLLSRLEQGKRCLRFGFWFILSFSCPQNMHLKSYRALRGVLSP